MFCAFLLLCSPKHCICMERCCNVLEGILAGFLAERMLWDRGITEMSKQLEHHQAPRISSNETFLGNILDFPTRIPRWWPTCHHKKLLVAGLPVCRPFPGAWASIEPRPTVAGPDRICKAISPHVQWAVQPGGSSHMALLLNRGHGHREGAPQSRHPASCLRERGAKTSKDCVPDAGRRLGGTACPHLPFVICRSTALVCAPCPVILAHLFKGHQKDLLWLWLCKKTLGNCNIS